MKFVQVLLTLKYIVRPLCLFWLDVASGGDTATHGCCMF